MTTIIDSLVFSELLYCASVWAYTTKKNIELLQTVQNSAARIVSGTRKFDHVTPILKQLQCQKFKTSATLGIGIAYIYHSVGELQVRAHLLSEAKSYGIVSQMSFSLSQFSMYLK